MSQDYGAKFSLKQPPPAIKNFMYRGTTLCTLQIAVDFYEVLLSNLLHCVQSYRTVYNLPALGPWKGGGWALKLSYVLNHCARLACLFGAHVHKITNGRVIYTTLYVMILMRANPLLGPWTSQLFWAVKRHSPIGSMPFQGPKSLDVQGPSNGPQNGFARIKIITYGAV